MRVVSGEYGGRKLKALQGDNTRPTTDKVKGAIFNMIGPYFDGGLVLDLYSGSGSLGIESVSRGCTHAICVDKHFQAIQVIKENVAITKEASKFTIVKKDAKHFLSQLALEKQVFDYIFLDPPYAQQTIVEHIQFMLNNQLLAEDGLIICETDKQVDLPQDILELSIRRQQNYGTTDITIYERRVD